MCSDLSLWLDEFDGYSYLGSMVLVVILLVFILGWFWLGVSLFGCVVDWLVHS